MRDHIFSGIVLLLALSSLMLAAPLAAAPATAPTISNMSCSPNPTTTDTTVACRADVTTYFGAVIKSYTWSFGDGTAITGSTPVHSWSFAGAYTVTLAVIDSDGEPGTSSVVEVVSGAGGQTFGPPQTSPPPQAPSNLSATALDGQRIRFDWNDSSAYEDGIRLYDAAHIFAVLPAHTTSYTVVGLQPGFYYCAIAHAFGPGGISGWSNWACAQTPAPQPPAAPLNLAATALSSSAIQLDWQTASSDADGFAIVDSTTGTTVARVAAQITTYTLLGLNSGARYCTTVHAFNEAGDSAPSNEACAMTLP